MVVNTIAVQLEVNKWVLNHYIRLLETYCVSVSTAHLEVNKWVLNYKNRRLI